LDVVVGLEVPDHLDEFVDAAEMDYLPVDDRRWVPDFTEAEAEGGGPDVCGEACVSCDAGGVFVDVICVYDNDGDGHLPAAAGGGDCDDSDPETYPEAPELCDGKDNDCNGQTDDGIPPSSCGLGVCKHTVTGCVYGTPVECDPFEGAGDEICNGLDSDCNGVVDDVPGGCECQEGEVQECGVNTGECKKGTQSCVGGKWTECSGQAPVVEVCDGKDNDCDGTVDNGVEGMGVPCGNEDLTNPAEGGCEQGSLACEGGELACPGLVEPSAEVCDGIDNDCDSVVDEGMSADEYEENDSCSMARDLGQIEENAGEMSVAATVYKDEADDCDWWKISTKELGEWWPCSMMPIPYVSDEPCLAFDLAVTPPSGLDLSLCVYAKDCDGDGGSGIFCSDNPTEPSVALGWHNKWGPGADLDLFVEVKAVDPGEQSCVPYTMVYVLYDVGCPVDGKCPWD